MTQIAAEAGRRKENATRPTCVRVAAGTSLICLLSSLVFSFPAPLEQGNYINGELRKPVLNEWFDGNKKSFQVNINCFDSLSFAVINPSDETVLSRCAKSTKEDVDAAVHAAKLAQVEWGKTTGSQRAAILRKIADAVEANADALSKKEATNAGKPLKEAAWDVSDVSVAFRCAPRISKLWHCADFLAKRFTYLFCAASTRTWRRSSTPDRARLSTWA